MDALRSGQSCGKGPSSVLGFLRALRRMGRVSALGERVI